MNIKQKKIDTKAEQDLLTGLIVSDRFCREIIPILHYKNLKSSYSRKVARWCTEFFKKYEVAPSNNIQDIYNAKVRDGSVTEEEADIIESFLANLSKRYTKKEKFNDKILLDASEKYLTERKLQVLFEDGRTNLAAGRVDEVENSIAEYVRERRPESAGIDIIKDSEYVSFALFDNDDVLFRYPGALGHVIGDVLRGDFFSFMAPMKRGKTWWLEDFAVRCFLKKLKVLYISLEMPLNQVIRRFYMNFLGQPRKAKEIIIPYFTDDNQIDFRTMKKDGMNSKDVIKRIRSLSLAGKGGGIRVITKPSKSMTVADLRAEIYNHAHYDSFYPDVVIVDYADIMAPEFNSSRDVRHRIDETWARLRGVAQEINGLVVTATQSSRASFTKDIEEEDTSEDIRKLAHVTQMVVLNQTRDEKKNNAMRVGVLVKREDEFFIDDEALVTYQYGIGKAFLDSRYKKDVIF